MLARWHVGRRQRPHAGARAHPRRRRASAGSASSSAASSGRGSGSRVGQTSLRRVDSVLGAVVVTLAASLIIWFIGGALRTAGNPALSKAMAESKVLQVVNSVVPEQTGQVFASFRGFLSSQGFPQVFGGLAPEPITPVAGPGPALSRSRRRSARQVVRSSR